MMPKSSLCGSAIVPQAGVGLVKSGHAPNSSDHHARISADIVRAYFRHQAAELSGLPAQAHAAVEA
jgi:hypothetical protein